MATARKPANQPTVKTASKPVAAPTAATQPVLKKAAPSKAAPPVTAPQASPVKAAKTAKAVAPKVEKKAKPEKVKVVRDSFTIPKSEYAAIADQKKRALVLGTEVKKSELIRAGLMLLAASPDAAFSKALAQVPTLKTGRPGKA